MIIRTRVLHVDLQTSLTQRWHTILVIYMVEFTVKCPFIVCTQTAHGNMSRGKNVLRKPVLIGPIEFDIVIVRDMSEKATENKVY